MIVLKGLKGWLPVIDAEQNLEACILKTIR